MLIMGKYMIDKEHIHKYYSQLTDDALNQISKDNLEPEALEILRLELTSRQREKLAAASFSKMHDINSTHIPSKTSWATGLLISILVSIGLMAGGSSKFFVRMNHVNSASSKSVNCDIAFDQTHAIAKIESTLTQGSKPSDADIRQLTNEFNQYTICEEEAAKANGSSTNKYEIVRMYMNRARLLFSEGKDGDNSFNKFRTIMANELRKQ